MVFFPSSHVFFPHDLTPQFTCRFISSCQPLFILCPLLTHLFLCQHCLPAYTVIFPSWNLSSQCALHFRSPLKRVIRRNNWKLYGSIPQITFSNYFTQDKAKENNCLCSKVPSCSSPLTHTWEFLHLTLVKNKLKNLTEQATATYHTGERNYKRCIVETVILFNCCILEL